MFQPQIYLKGENVDNQRSNLRFPYCFYSVAFCDYSISTVIWDYPKYRYQMYLTIL